MATMSPLRRRMIEDMVVRNLSPETQQSYVRAVAKFSKHFGRSPDRLGAEEVRAYQVHLTSQGVAWASLNQTVCALRFFYGVTLKRGEIVELIPYARTPRRLPVVLSGEEVVRFLEAVPGLKARAALTTAYAAGLRLSEVVALKVCDIDSQRMVVRIARGKGGGERYAMLSVQLLNILRAYLAHRAPACLAVSGAQSGASDQSQDARHGVSDGGRGGPSVQAGHRPHVASQLRHAPFGERHRHSHHPSAAGPRPPVDHGAVHPGGDQHDRQDHEPARPP
jgi:integrase/recombinase XerD